MPIPGRRALPYITDAAFEGFGTVSESAHATVPKSVVRCRFGLSFWPLMTREAQIIKVNFHVCPLTSYTSTRMRLTEAKWHRK